MSLIKTYERYINRYVSEESKKLKNSPIDTEMIIVVPVHDESAYLGTLLNSLQALDKPNFHCELIFVVNESETAPSSVKASNDACFQMIKKTSLPDFLSAQIIELRSIKSKHAGVGLARKTGMDAAIINFWRLERNGIIVCLDADCEVDSNYLIAIENGMKCHPKALACSIHFEHPLEGIHSEQIIDYELHLRYFIDIQRSIHLPFAIQTVGSSMAVRAQAYAAYGGMNKRQAGEDFYFLQKFISVGGVIEINSTCVRPSDRSSSRVPFGTGKAIKDMLNEDSGFLTYSSHSFKEIQIFLDLLRPMYSGSIGIENAELSIHPVLLDFLKRQDWIIRINEIRHNTKQYESFEKRFYQWFNAFMLMKCLHHLRDHAFPNKSVGEEVKVYLSSYYNERIDDKKDQLIFLRAHQKSSNSLV